MIIDKKIVYARKKEEFEPLIPTIPEGLNPVVFIEDTREMWTCGTYFSIGYPSIEVSEVSGSVKVQIGNSFFLLTPTGDSISLRKGDGNRIIISSNALNRVDTEPPLEWDAANRKLLHKASGVVPGSYGQSTNLGNASIFVIPNIIVDATGHITLAENHNIEIRDYVEQLAPSNQMAERNILLSYNEANNNMDTSQVRKANGLTFNDATQRITVAGGMVSDGAVTVNHGDLSVLDGYIIGNLKGDVQGEATPKIHLSLKPEYGGASTKLYGHVKLQDILSRKPDPSSDNENINDTNVVAAIAASPLMVWNAIETAKSYADSILGSNNAMLFKGALEAGISSPGTYTPMADVGNTYVVTFGNGAYRDSVGYINGVSVEVGDLLICKEATAASDGTNWEEVSKKWTYVQTNTTGVVSGPSSSTIGQLAVFDSITGKLIKGLPNGSVGQMLVINESGTPTWANKPDRLNHALSFQVKGVEFTSFDGYEAKKVNFIAGDNMFITPDNQGNLTLAADPGNDTVNTAGATNLINKKLFLIGAESQTTSPQTYSNQYVYIGTDNCLYSLGKKVLTEHQAIYNLDLQTQVGDAVTKVTTFDPNAANNSFTLVQGTNVTLIPDTTNKKVTISSKDTTYDFYNLAFKQGDAVIDTYKPTTAPNKAFRAGTNVTFTKSGDEVIVTTQDTRNTAGATEKLATKLFLTGSLTQTDNPQTYTNSKVYIGVDNKLYSDDKVVSTGDHTHNYAGATSPGGPALKVDLNPSGLLAATYGSYGGILQDSNNGPVAGSWSNRIKILYNYSSGYYTELAQAFTGTAGLWHRRNVAGVVSDWTPVIDKANFHTYLDATYVIRGNDPNVLTNYVRYSVASGLTMNWEWGNATPTHIWGAKGGDNSKAYVFDGDNIRAFANAVNRAGDTMTGTLGMGANTIYWKENGFGDKFGLTPYFSGANDNNYLAFMSSVGEAGTDPAMTAKMVLTGLGNVGIGTTTPTQKLHVIGGGLFTALLTTTGITNNGTLTQNGDIIINQASTTGTRQVEFQGGDNDYGRVAYGGTASNAGWMEIASCDDGMEPIYARQYTGVFTTVKRTATLLDANGNTVFPGTVTAPTFTGALNGTAEWSKRLATNSQLTFGLNGLTYFNANLGAGTAANQNVGPSPQWWHILRMNHGNGSGYFADIAVPLNTSDGIYWRRIQGGTNYGWYKVLDTNNYAVVIDGRYVNVTGDTMTGALSVATHLEVRAADTTTNAMLILHNPNRSWGNITFRGNMFYFVDGNSSTGTAYRPIKANYYIASATTLCTNLNADLLDGNHEHVFLRHRDTYSIDGYGTLWAQIGIRQYDNAKPDGMANPIYNYGAVISLPANGPRLDIWYNHTSSASDSSTNGIQYRSGWGTDKKPWRMLLDSVNAKHYNVGSATKLQTARQINGTNFDGTANIVTSYWGTARNFTIGNTTRSVNGSGNVTWSFADIGGAPASHSHNYINSRGNLNPQTGRTQNLGNVYSYNTISGTSNGAPTTYTSVIGFGRSTEGTVEIAGGWTASMGLWYRALRDTADNWYGWVKVWDTKNFDPNSKANSNHNHDGSYITKGGSNNNVVLGAGGYRALSDFTLNSNWAASKDVAGYVKFPNGFIIQWGEAYVGANATGYKHFPIAFPTACISVQVTHKTTATNWDKVCVAGNYTRTGCTIANGETVASMINWMALGY